MPDFYIAVLLILTSNGELGFEAVPVQSYAECRQMTQLGEALAKAQYPDADIRTSCIASESIGQNGV